MRVYALTLQFILLLTLGGILQGCGASSSPTLSFASFTGKRLPVVLEIMKNWGYDSLVRNDALQNIYFNGTQLPGAKDTCLLGIWYSRNSDTVIELVCEKITKPNEEFKFANPAPVNDLDFRRWDSLLTLQYGPPADSVKDTWDTYLYWKGEREIAIDYQLLRLYGQYDTVPSSLIFRSFWKREKRDGSHYRESDVHVR